MLVTLDFETYYDADYTLKKLSTSEYIRDPRFEAINCALRWDGEYTVLWGQEEIGRTLRDVFARCGDIELLAHHAQFEGLILSHHFGLVPRVFRDTLSMARGCFPKSDRNDLATLAARLGVANKLAMPDFKGKHLADFTPELRASVADYVVGDVESCYQAYQKLLAMLPAAELDLIDATVRMFADPVIRLDEPAAKAELEREIRDKGALILASGVPEEVLQSSAKLAKKLRELGVEPPMKISERTHKPALAMAQTDLEFAALQKHPNKAVADLVKGRLAAKSTLAESRATRLLKAGANGQLVPVYLNYHGAMSTRWSGGDKLNFQNFTRGSPLRPCLLAPPDCVLVVIDSSQIQTRLLAWLSGEEWLLDAFATGTDPYGAFGLKVYGEVVHKGDPRRDLMKACVLALGFGAGAFQLQRMVAWGTYCPAQDLPIEVCEGFVKAYRTSRGITGLWRILQCAIGDLAKGREGDYKVLSWEKDLIRLPNGMALRYPGTSAVVEQQRMGAMFGNRVEEYVVSGSYMGARSRQKLYGGLMTADVMQGLERAIVGEQMRQISKRYRVAMMSHDEVVFVAPAQEADEALEFGLAEFRRRPDWGQDIPLDADGGYAANYSK